MQKACLAEVLLLCLDIIAQVLLPWYLLKFFRFHLVSLKIYSKGSIQIPVCVSVYSFDVLSNIVTCGRMWSEQIFLVGWKSKIISVSFCIPRNVGSLIFWEHHMEPSESRRLVCAWTVNNKLKLDDKHSYKNRLLQIENWEFWGLWGRFWQKHCPAR